jgi:DNA-directed RNA polymerase subunit K/omega
VGGALGVKDEFEDLLTDATSRFGLANLVAALKRGTQVSSTPQKDFSIKESLDKRVSKALNEEFKRIFKY